MTYANETPETQSGASADVVQDNRTHENILQKPSHIETKNSCSGDSGSSLPKGVSRGNRNFGDSPKRKSSSKRRPRIRRDFAWFVKRFELRNKNFTNDIGSAVIKDMNQFAEQFARRLPPDKARNAEDAVAEVLGMISEGCWLHQFNVRWKTKLRNFVFTTIKRKLLRSCELHTLSLSPELGIQPATQGDDPHKIVESKEQVARMRRDLKSLSNRDRRLLGDLRSRRRRHRRGGQRYKSTIDVRRNRLRQKLGLRWGIDVRSFTRTKRTSKRPPSDS